MEPVAGHLTAADRTLPGHPVRPQDDVAAQDRTPQAADGQSADRSGSLQLPLPFLKAGPAGGRLRRPSSAAEPLVRSFGKARTCAANGCDTQLSRYKPAPCCYLHKGGIWNRGLVGVAAWLGCRWH